VLEKMGKTAKQKGKGLIQLGVIAWTHIGIEHKKVWADQSLWKKRPDSGGVISFHEVMRGGSAT